MDATEHEAARACWLRPEAKMDVSFLGPRGRLLVGTVGMTDGTGAAQVSVFRGLGQRADIYGCAPGTTGAILTDRATYLLALAQYAERVGLGGHPSEAPSIEALLRNHWPDVLAELLRATAPGESEGPHAG